MVAGFLALVAIHIAIAAQVHGPIVLQDESGYLGNARWLAGLDPVPEMGDAPIYAWGYSLLIVPLAAAIEDPAVLYRSIQVLNSVLLAALFPLLWALLSRVTRLGHSHLLVAAAVGSVFPATLVHSTTAWAENLLAPLTVALALTIWWTATERPAWQRTLVAPVAVWLHAAHPRYLVVLIVVAVGLLVAGTFRRIPRTVAAAGLALLALGWWCTRLVSIALVDARWPDRSPDQGSTGRLLRRIVDPGNLPEIAGGAAGEGWYLMAGSLGLVAVGALAIAWWLTHDDGLRLRSMTILDDDRRLAVAATVVAMVALFATSVVSFVGTAERVDHLIYGRYNESFAPLLVAAGAAAFLAAPSAAARTWLALAGAALTVFTGAALWIGRGADAFDGEVVWNNILALHPIADLVGTDVAVPVGTAVAAVALVGLAVGARWSPRVAMGGVGLLLAVVGMLAVEPLADFSAVRYDGWAFPDQMQRITELVDADEVGLDREHTGLMAVHIYPYWSPAIDFDLVDDPIGQSAPPLVVARPGSPELVAGGARIVALDGRNEQALWARPGPTLDALVARGAALPAGFPTALPDAAREATIVRTGRGALEVTSGGTTRVEVELTHAGRGSPWPDDGSWPLPGVVRVGARWYDPASVVVAESGRTALRAPMWPGDTSALIVELSAVDDDGNPLAPGRYTVSLDLVHEGFSWFHPPGDEPLRLDVEVVSR
ncbi:MAG: hypothetical protein JJE52_13845 [Acidimicrobiia bacterium]|nr:hypothetical protein [Acidimicrobiia bacterium]